MTEIIPAVMPGTLEELASAVAPLRGAVPFIQIDSMDGFFVPNKSFPYSDWQDFSVRVAEEGELPHWRDFNYEFDIMAKNPKEVAGGLIRLGAARLVFHIESAPQEEIISLINEAQEFGAEAGVALGNETPLESVSQFREKADFVQLMGIARIGFQGEPFDERVLSRIKKLRSEYPDLIISVDGGVNFDTASQLVEAGANRLVAGSSIFGSVSPKEAIINLKNAVSD
ncbi:MAG: hypothetical protein AAB355_01670 [Patescibacteria group bacterium]